MLDNNTKVAIVVPFGPNQGQITAFGVIVGRIMGGIDGDRYIVRESDGSENEHSVTWVRKQ